MGWFDLLKYQIKTAINQADTPYTPYEMKPVTPELTQEEAAALDMLKQYRFSRSAMARDGAQADYETLGVDPAREALWLHEQAEEWLEEAPTDAAALEAVTALAEEYGGWLITRLAEALDEAVTRERIPDETLLQADARLADLLERFEPTLDADTAEQAWVGCGEIAARIETRLREAGADVWRLNALDRIRAHERANLTPLRD